MFTTIRHRAKGVVALALLFFVLTPASSSSQAELGGCGSDVTPEEAARYLEILAGPGPDVAPSQPGPYCVPIAAHIVRTSAGTGGMPLSQLTQAIIDCNLHYANMDISFYVLLVDYIDDDFFYYNISTRNDIDALRSTNVVSAAINIYFTPNLPGLCGTSSFTFSSVQGIVMANGCTGLPDYPSVVSHEVGHYFDLFHTHETAFGLEFVNGTNCTTAGDLFCDTPADPNLGGKVNSSCVYFAGEVDPNGDPYAPDVSQIMSYARAICADTFSPESEAKALTTLLNQRADHLVRGCDPVLPATIAAATPPLGFQDQTLDLVLVGSNFRQYTSVLMGPDIAATTIDTLSTSDSLLVNLMIDADATPGFVDIVVTNGSAPDTLNSYFEVKETLTHYVSVTGGNVYPYARPQDAALSLADAVAAAAAGDSVLADTTTVSNLSMNVQTAITMSGGWTDNFTHRDLANKKTTLDLNGNILLGSATGTTTMDGFVLKNGNGSLDVAPVNGKYGGAIRVIYSTAVISNCEMHNNDANDGLGFGGGGAVYAIGADVTVAGCHIHHNDATRGGAIYLYQSSATLTGNTIELNTVATGGTTNPDGAGVAIHDCSTVTMVDNVITGNDGAINGGGFWIVNTTSVDITGGEITGHTVTNDGGGIRASSTALSVTGTRIAGNSGGFFGGAIAAMDTCTTTLVDCEIQSNTALIGAGVTVNFGEAYLRHNLVTGNGATSTGGGMYIAGTTAGDVIGNTLNANSGPTGVGGVLLANGTGAIFNNIVANSTGEGISVAGGAASVSYNLVWNSSGSDYAGVSPGTGAVSADPLFVGAPSNDYHLALNSPAIDAGDPSPAYDDPDGSRGDMGAYGSHAFAMEQPSYPKNVATGTSAGQLTISWDANPEGDVDYYAVYCDTTSGFVPSPGTLVSTTPDTSLTIPTPTDTTYYRVSAVDTSGYAGGFSGEAVSVPGTASGVETSPVRFSLLQNYPNPFNPSTTISFSVAARVRVDLVVYDVAGRRVRTLVGDDRVPDVYKVTWDGTNDSGERVASGIYFYRLQAGTYTQTRKMVLVK